jgi:hypothetical protein
MAILFDLLMPCPCDALMMNDLCLLLPCVQPSACEIEPVNCVNVIRATTVMPVAVACSVGCPLC